MKTHQLGQKTEHGYSDVSIGEWNNAGSRARIIDVREPSEFNAELGHLEGAELVPLATLPTIAESWSRDEPLLLVCRSGARSGRAASALAQMGFNTVMNLAGGMLAVRAQG